MRRAVMLLALLAAAAAGPARAETVRVRSGEHSGFTRLVLALGRPADWTLSGEGTAWQLRLGRPDIRLDLSEVFRRIPRTRLASAEAAGPVLHLGLACACTVSAFEDRPGLVVIDIAGAAPAPAARRADALRPRPRPDAAAAPRLRVLTGGPNDPFQDPLWWIRPAGPGGSGAAPPAAPVLPSDEAEAHLLRQLARAASQGLVAPARPERRTPAPPPAPEAGPAPRPPPDPPSGPPPGRRLRDALQAETAIDREVRATPRIVLTEEEGACTPEPLVDVAAWGDGSDPADQIARARARLVGEFDRADPDAVLGLARLYLHLGLGAEARATLAAFGAEGPAAAAAAALAPLVDGGSDPDGPFAGQAGCRSAVALWALLAAPDLPRGARVATDEALRAFSALPAPLRRHLAPALADRFLARGDTEAVRALRDAAARAPGGPDPGLALVTARLALTRGAAAEAERILAELADGSGTEAAEALALLLEARLGRDAPAEPGRIEAAAALARELAGGPLGQRLWAAHARSEAARGAFGAAFAAVDALAGTAPALAARVADDLYLRLAERGPDRDVLRFGFPGTAPAGRPAPGGMPARRALADRLTALGFGAAAARVLGRPETLGPEDRLRAARAALAEDDPHRALALADGVAGAAADALRGDALTRLGDHRAAAAAYSAAGHAGAAAGARWRAGMVAGTSGAPESGAAAPEAAAGVAAGPAAETAAGTAAGAADRFRLAALLLGDAPPDTRPDATDTPPAAAEAAAGPLARARALLAASRAERAAAAALDAQHPPP